MELVKEQRFGFGENWTNYIQKNLADDRVDVSGRHMLDFLGSSDLVKKSFLDIGCGSGLHSYAALKSGADRIVGFDFDIDSVGAARIVHQHAGSPGNWEISQGSILDETFVRSLGQFDLVYSWGVLHHTGDVWSAIRNAAVPVKSGGLFYIALYSADAQKAPYTPEFWLDVKQKYLHSSWLGKRRMEWWYIHTFILGGSIRRLPELLKRRSEYRKNRGMDMMTDIRDWLGGWPMEFVYDIDAVEFCEGLGLKLERMKTGEANTEFLFQRVSIEVTQTAL